MNEVRPEVPVELAAIVARMMAKDPGDRYQTPAEVARALVPFFPAGNSESVARPAAALPGASPSADDPAPLAPGTPIFLPPAVAECKPGGPAVAQPFASADAHPGMATPLVWPRVVGAMGLVAVVIFVALALFRDPQAKTARDAGKIVGESTASPTGEPSTPWSADRAGEVHVVRVGDQEVRFHWCPAGSFRMGSPTDEEGRYKIEGPVAVTLTRGYWMMETEVTQGLWQTVMGRMWNWDTSTTLDLPVCNVDHRQAMAFGSKLAQLLRESGQLPPGMSIRLPTEAEWEWAARAGTTARFYFGDDKDMLGDYAWFGANSGGQPREVRTRKPNAWGLHDMLGNVWERCHDWAENQLQGGTDPRGFLEAPNRAFRRGGWNSDPRNCRLAVRGWDSPMFRADDVGFRLAAVLE